MNLSASIHGKSEVRTKHFVPGLYAVAWMTIDFSQMGKRPIGCPQREQVT